MPFVALALVLTGCGEAPTRPIGVREYPADIALGEQERIPPPTVPPAADLAPAFPGFLAPPAPRDLDVAPSPATTSTTVAVPITTTTTVALPACPDPDPLAVPTDEAQGFVPAPPAAESIPFRVGGTTTVDDVTTPLAAEAIHRIGATTPFGDATFRYDVEISEGDRGTVTTYQVDQRSASNVVDGVSIVQIRTTDEIATDAFTPSAPIRILPLPPVKGLRFSSSGADPLHATSITIFGQVVDKTRVNACGIPLEAWLVRVGPDPQTGQPSAIRGPTKNVVITGTYAIAPQFGGLVISDALRMEGTDGGSRVLVDRTSSTNRRPAGGKA